MKSFNVKKITVNYLTKEVEVFIENGIIKNLNNFINKDCKYFLITDENISKLYLNNIQGNNLITCVIKAGEESKNFETVNKIILELLENNISKKDYLIAFGGGVITDLVGFVASIYKRGINYLSIPTTLLSQVDSCLGGKCGIDFHNYKNQIGSIYHPEKILVDPTLLLSLPNTEWQSGMGEVIKYGLCFDEQLFFSLFEDFSIDDIIYQCIKIKANITSCDEFENNIRFTLNYGHTIGHALESISDYSIPHGIAVCIGMLYETNDKNIKDKLLSLYQKLNINVNYSFSKSDLIQYIIKDKKRENEYINIPILEKIGQTKVEKIKFSDFLRGLE